MNNTRDKTAEAIPTNRKEKKRKRNVSPKVRERPPKGLCTYQHGNTIATRR